MEKPVFQAGDILQIELYTGRKLRVEVLRNTTDEIVVKNTTELRTGRVRAHNQIFGHSEIKEICPIRVTSVDTNDQIENQNDDENNRVPFKKKSFSNRDIEIIQAKVQNATHIAQFDNNYYNAVDDLMKQDIVFVNYESIFGRLDPKRSVLTIATHANVYVFDMLRLGAMKKELKELFSSELPRKVVHSTAEFADYLKHKEQCSLNGIFDTLMVHFSLKKTREHSKLQQCLEEYMDLPDDFVLQKQNFQGRPLPIEALVQSTLNTILLMKLYWHMNDVLMKPLHDATAKFAEIYQRVDNPVDLMVLVNDLEHPGVERIELNATEMLDEAFDL